tara:strand:- start:1476 stop:1904 length:429 start_codon:yes stop_codon:yes gene_type:complete
MTIALYDTIDDVISMIKTKWNTSTGGVIPRIERIWDEKTIGFGDQEISKGIILIEAMDESVKYFSLYGADHMHTIDLTLDVRSYQNLDRHDVIMKEVTRIIKDQIRREGFIDLRIAGTVPLSRLYRNMFRHMVRITFRKMNP